MYNKYISEFNKMMMLLTTTPQSPANSIIDNTQNDLEMRRNSPTILLDVEVEEPQPAQVSFIDDKE